MHGVIGLRAYLSACRFEVQLQYGAIGWSVGATMGFALGAPERRMLSLIGDGSFQIAAQVFSCTLLSVLWQGSNMWLGWSVHLDVHSCLLCSKMEQQVPL